MASAAVPARLSMAMVSRYIKICHVCTLIHILLTYFFIFFIDGCGADRVGSSCG